ncbi:MAG TPA: CapA family protein [Candidatus Udaeobacter sp.]|nr:CapA family protein [Candidatus Udaeobacter sp.]
MNRQAAALCMAAMLIASSLAARVLPIYIEDNHAGTFFWLAQNLDLDQPCTLILFDAHSDATGIFDSDRIREALRNVGSSQERQALLDRWRSEGAVQCFNWIEPLMPAPIAQVIWVPAEKLSVSEISKRTQETNAILDGHIEAAPRKSGSLHGSYVVSDFGSLEKHFDSSRPLVITIDLDYFAGLSVREREAAFAHIWKFVIERPNLRAVTFAISRPYLRHEDETYHLLKLALNSALSLPTAQIQFEPYLTVANDQSNLSKKLMLRGQKPPAFDLAHAPSDLRARILSERHRIVVRHDAERWQHLLDNWNDEAPQLHLQIKGHEASTDNVWRIPAHDPVEIELVTEPWMTKPDRIEWFALIPKYQRCNVTNLSTDQVGFVANAAPRPAWTELPVDHHDPALPIGEIDNLFDRQWHCGSLRLRARALVDGTIRETPVLELRRFMGSGFRAAISEEFGLPYLFGSGELSEDSDTGPETNLGADCANFIVYALRRQGRRVPWSDPKRLRDALELVERSVKPRTAKISADDLERGVIIDLGTHVAAVTEDREPVGILDENDIVAHQLGGTPEMLTLGQLLQERRKNCFDLFRVPPEKPAATLVFGGDVMLGRSCAAKIENGADPFAGIATILRGASFAAANLECTISNLGNSHKRYVFRAPELSAELLHRAGFRAMGLANNHALDFGPAALEDCANRLFREQILPVGVGKPGSNPWTPSFFSRHDGKKIALLAVNEVDSASGSQIRVVSDRLGLNTAIANARRDASFVACLVHWGIENSEKTTDGQREFARWLVDHGVDLVVGSHPHCVQQLDFYHGCPIAYSLGNLVFDGAPTVQSWNRGALLQVGLSENGQASSARLIPVVLEDGLPRVDVATKIDSPGNLEGWKLVAP